MNQSLLCHVHLRGGSEEPKAIGLGPRTYTRRVRIAPVYSVVSDLQDELPGCPFTSKVVEMGTGCFISHLPIWTRTVSLQSGSRAGSLASLGYREQKLDSRRCGYRFLHPSSEGTGIKFLNVGMLSC